MSWSCEPYQPLPISTGTSGLDRCGNVVAYAAPSTVQAPVGWGCWPIQFQGWWLYQGPFGPCPPSSGSPGWGGPGWWPWWGGPEVMPPVYYPPGTAPPWWPWPNVNLSQLMSGGKPLADWMISQRQQAAPAQRRAA